MIVPTLPTEAVSRESAGKPGHARAGASPQAASRNTVEPAGGAPSTARASFECEVCTGDGIRVCDQMKDGFVVIERCDLCQIYENDLAAAKAWGEDAHWIHWIAGAIAVARPGANDHIDTPDDARRLAEANGLPLIVLGQGDYQRIYTGQRGSVRELIFSVLAAAAAGVFLVWLVT